MRTGLTLLAVFLFFSCGEKVVEPPENLISREVMADILYDMALISASKSVNVKALEEHGIEPMEYIYKKYKIDSAQFVNSNIYYISIPQQYEAIYRKVEARLDAERKKFQEAKTKSKDSITRPELNNKGAK